MLLHSCPDTVHEFLLRKTQTSSPLIRGSPAVDDPRGDITPAGADCRYRAPLSPRLHGNFMTYVGLYADIPSINITAHTYTSVSMYSQFSIHAIGPFVKESSLPVFVFSQLLSFP